MLFKFAASPHLECHRGPSQLLIKRWKRKKSRTPTLSPWEVGAGCLAFQLTAVSDHKSSETHCSVVAGAMARLSWWHLLGRTLLGSQAFLQKSILQFEKKIPSELLEASAVTACPVTSLLLVCPVRLAFRFCADIWDPADPAATVCRRKSF